MQEVVETFRGILMSASLCALLALLAVLCGIKSWGVIKPVVSKWSKRGIVFAIPFLIVAIIHGGSKPTISFPYTDPKVRYFTDAGSEVRDDSIWLAFTAFRIPLSADFHGCYRELVEEGENTNEWVEFLLGTVGAYIEPQEIAFPNAKGYEFCFFSTYVEGPTVHTNGVLNVKWGIPTNALQEVIRALPIQSEVRMDWGIIATPDHDVDIDPQSDSLLIRLMEETEDEQ